MPPMKTHALVIVSFVTLGLLTVAATAQRGQGAGRGSGAGRESSGTRPASGRAYEQQPETGRVRQEQMAQPGPQNPAPPRVSLAERLQQETQLRRDLGLTDKQEAALVRIREREQNDLKLINQERLMTKGKKEMRIREAIDKRSAEVRALLTPQQRAKLDQAMARDQDRDRDKDRDRDQTRTQLSQPEKAQNP